MKRLNSCRVEWMPFLSGNEYKLLDKLLFQSNLTEANHGLGFIFHIRQLEKETGIPRSSISSIVSQWPFMEKVGKGKAMNIYFNYSTFETWIVRLLDNDCPPIEPISKKEEIRCTLLNTEFSTTQNITTTDKPKYETWLLDTIKEVMQNCPLKTKYPVEHIKFINNLSNQFNVDTGTLLEIYLNTQLA